MLIIGIFIGLFMSFANNYHDDCSDFKELMKAPPESRYEYRGRYVNLSYQYSVVIPKGLIAYDGRHEPNHTGFWIALGKSPQSFILVRGDHNSLEYATSREAATKSLEFLRQAGKKIESEKISEVKLGTLNAIRLEVIYTCPGSSDRRLLTSIIAVRADKRFRYELELYSPINRHKLGQGVLSQIMKSWKPVSSSPRKKQ